MSAKERLTGDVSLVVDIVRETTLGHGARRTGLKARPEKAGDGLANMVTCIEKEGEERRVEKRTEG